MLSGIPGNAASSYVRYRNCNGEPSVGVVVSAASIQNSIFGSASHKGDEKGVYVEPSHPAQSQAGGAAFVILGAITFCHLLNDVMQALLPAIYPMLKSGFALSFGQIGLLTLIFQVTASLLQPMVGLYTDRRPQPYSLPLGMACSLLGMCLTFRLSSFDLIVAGQTAIRAGSLGLQRGHLEPRIVYDDGSTCLFAAAFPRGLLQRIAGDGEERATSGSGLRRPATSISTVLLPLRH